MLANSHDAERLVPGLCRLRRIRGQLSRIPAVLPELRCAIAGSATLTVTTPMIARPGSGTQTLSGGQINYTGATAVNNGTLELLDTTGYASTTTAASGAVGASPCSQPVVGSSPSRARTSESERS